MSLDAFGNYSRSVRQGATVHRVFFGKGPVAQLAAAMDDQRRADRQASARVWAALEAARARAEASLLALDGLADLMMRATLMAAGYHRHDRGSWRRRMNDKGGMNGNPEGSVRIVADVITPAPGAESCQSTGSIHSDTGDGQLTEAELRELLGRAERGDRTLLTALRRLLDSRPALRRLCGDVANTAQADWIGLIAGRNLVVRESLVRKVTELKGEIAAPDASPLERLLAERVSCWLLQANHADSVAAQLKGQERTIAQLDLIQKRQERTQRSFLTAIKALAVVRKLAVAGVPTAPPRVRGPRRHGQGGLRMVELGRKRTQSRRRITRPTTGLFEATASGQPSPGRRVARRSSRGSCGTG